MTNKGKHFSPDEPLVQKFEINGVGLHFDLSRECDLQE